MDEKIAVKLEDVNKLLDGYNKKVGVSDIVVDGTIEQYLQMTREEMGKLTPEDCGEIAYTFARMSYKIQSAYNREMAIANWAEANTKMLIIAKINSYSGYSFEERKLQAIKDNEIALALEKVRVQAKLRADAINSMANRVEFMAKMINDMKYAKVKQRV